MRTHCDAPQTHPEEPHIVIINSKKLRRAGLVSLLDTWAEATGLAVRAVELAGPIERRRSANCAMVILSVGSASINDPEQQIFIKCTRNLMPRPPLVVISDREEPKEVHAAFEAGAAGFLPTSIDPSVALQALSFIKGGGSFFPPSALQETPAIAVERADQAGVRLLTPPSRLSVKQEEVLTLLRQGRSNKAIASQLGLSEATVKVHLRCIMRKLGVANRTQVAIAALSGRVESLT